MQTEEQLGNALLHVHDPSIAQMGTSIDRKPFCKHSFPAHILAKFEGYFAQPINSQKTTRSDIDRILTIVHLPSETTGPCSEALVGAAAAEAGIGVGSWEADAV